MLTAVAAAAIPAVPFVVVNAGHDLMIILTIILKIHSWI